MEKSRFKIIQIKYFNFFFLVFFSQIKILLTDQKVEKTKFGSPVGWGCRIHRLHIQRGVRPPPKECPGFGIK